jgi:hypothetical protein
MSAIGTQRWSDVRLARRLCMSSVLLAMLSTSVASSASGQAYQYSDYPVTPIHFPAGKTTTTINDSVERGGSATYTFLAKEGQHADIQLTTEEDNASFIFYMPGATVSKDDGGYDVSGPTLPNAGRHGRATHWTGRLPVSGKYTLTIQPNRGGASYHLTITIR